MSASSNHPTYVIDFETYYDKDFSLSKVTTESYIRDARFQVIGVCVRRSGESNPIDWITGDEATIHAGLKTYHLEDAIVVAHNAAFDMAILNWKFGIRPFRIVDTLSMARACVGIQGVKCSLRSLAEHYRLGHKGDEVYNTLGKRREDFSPETMQRFADYCKMDVELTDKLYGVLKNRGLPGGRPFPVQEMCLIDLTIRMFTEPVIELDKSLLEARYKELLDKKEALLDSVSHGNRDAFMSNEAFAQLLRDEGVEPPMKVSGATGKKTYAFAKTDLEFKELLKHPNERVQALVSARLGLKSTIEETRTKAFIDIAERGTMPIMLNYYGAQNTGRWSGGEKLNPQNLPRVNPKDVEHSGYLRRAMKAPAGHCIVACDSSQIEARTLAWMAGQEDLVEQFREGKDVYSLFASKVFNKPINKHEHPKERQLGKTCILGLGYGTGAAKLWLTLHNGGNDTSEDECRRIVDIYRKEAYPRIKRFWTECNKAIASMFNKYDFTVGEGYKVNFHGTENLVDLPNGMVLQFPGLKAEEGQYGHEYLYLKKGIPARLYGGSMTENIIQSLARIVVGQQMLAIANAFEKQNETKRDGLIRRVVHMVHDEIVCVVPEPEMQWAKELMERIMSTTPTWATGLPIACESGSGKSYGDAK